MADGSAESVQQKIAIARRDAEALKDRIKKKKDELADTTRESMTTLTLTLTLAFAPPFLLDLSTPPRNPMIRKLTSDFNKQYAMSRGNAQNLYLDSP